MGGKLHRFPSSLLLLFLSVRLAISQSRVRNLPGFDGPLPFHLETGYVGVGKLEADQLFYYYLESQKNPKEDPLVFWLTGGPGCSGLSALFCEIGPLQLDKVVFNGNILKLVLRSYPWTNVSSIIFVDSPVQTGFSYSEGSDDDETGDIKTSQELHEFVRKWLIGHPQHLASPVYIGGDSYGGKFTPIVAQEIVNGNEAKQEPIINFQGYLVGNPVLTDKKYDSGSVVPFVHGMGLISDELYESARKNCKEDYYTNRNDPKCAEDLEAVNELISGVNAHHILEPVCDPAGPQPKGLRRAGRSLKLSLPVSYPLPNFDCPEYNRLLSNYWADIASVRRALHIRPGTVGEWERCKHLNFVEDVQGTVGYHLNLTTKGYRALVYSGDHDLIAPFAGTQAWIRSLNFSVLEHWRPWTVDGQVTGYTTTYSNNLTFATVKGAGHEAAGYRPKECFAMYQRWISHKPL